MCVSCGRTLREGAVFCAACGQRQQLVPPAPRGDLRMVITFYVATLALAMAWMAYARITEDGFGTDVGVTASFATLTVIFAVSFRTLIGAPLTTRGFGLAGYAAIVAASVAIVLVVAVYARSVNNLFGIHVPGELDAYRDHSVAVAVVMVAVVPPLAEEIAFRGLIYGGLRRSLTPSEAMIVSSFAFAIMHLSVPMLITHFPLGLYLCWLRRRSDSLWPGIFAHACHNLGVCLLELCG